MRKFFRYIAFYVKTAFTNIRRNLGLSLSAAFSVTITLVLIATFLLISSNVSTITNHIEEEVLIRAKIDRVLSVQEQKDLQQKMISVENVKSVTFSTGDQELASYREEYDGNANLFSMYEGKTNPILDAFLIEVQDADQIKQTANQIKGMDGIVEASYGGEHTEKMITIFKGVRAGSFLFIIFLMVVAIFLIANKIKISIYTRKDELAIMRFVGASNCSIRLPMMLEGVMVSLLGSILPIVVCIVGYYYIYELVNYDLDNVMFMLRPVFPLCLWICLILLGISFAVGLLGSLFSTSRYIRFKR